MHSFSSENRHWALGGNEWALSIRGKRRPLVMLPNEDRRAENRGRERVCGSWGEGSKLLPTS